MERHYGGCLCYGPPIDNGFFYDMFIEDRLDKRVTVVMVTRGCGPLIISEI